jgi:hypothetical protein
MRVEYPNASYHVTSRGIERKTIFKADNEPKVHGRFGIQLVWDR